MTNFIYNILPLTNLLGVTRISISYTALLFVSLAHNSDNVELKSPDRIEDINCLLIPETISMRFLQKDLN